MQETLERVCTVNLCRFVQRVVDVGQRGAVQNNAVTGTGPHAHNDKTGNKRCCVAPPVGRFLSRCGKQAVYDTVVSVENPLPHKRDCHNGTHIRNEVDCTEHLFATNIFCKQKRHHKRKNDVDKRGQAHVECVADTLPEDAVAQHCHKVLSVVEVGIVKVEALDVHKRHKDGEYHRDKTEQQKADYRHKRQQKSADVFLVVLFACFVHTVEIHNNLSLNYRRCDFPLSESRNAG